MGRTLSEVAKLTGAKRRSVQLWADAGIIQPVKGTDRAGTGVHRRFSIEEVRLIALLVPLAKWGVPIGWLQYFASEFRRAIAEGGSDRARPKMTRERLAGALSRATEGKGNNYLLFMHLVEYLWFEVITDEEGPSSVDLTRCFASSWRTSSMMGVLDLNASFRGLSE